MYSQANNPKPMPAEDEYSERWADCEMSVADLLALIPNGTLDQINEEIENVYLAWLHLKLGGEHESCVDDSIRALQEFTKFGVCSIRRKHLAMLVSTVLEQMKLAMGMERF